MNSQCIGFLKMNNKIVPMRHTPQGNIGGPDLCIPDPYFQKVSDPKQLRNVSGSGCIC